MWETEFENEEQIEEFVTLHEESGNL